MIGATPGGLKINFHLSGGTVSGPGIQGKVRPAGGDWLTVRGDGIGLVDARVCFETHDNALLMLSYDGVIDFGADGYEKFLRDGPPPVAQIRVAARCSSGRSSYQWLNRVLCFGIGEYRKAERTAAYDIYALTG